MADDHWQFSIRSRTSDGGSLVFSSSVGELQIEVKSTTHDGKPRTDVRVNPEDFLRVAEIIRAVYGDQP